MRRPPFSHEWNEYRLLVMESLDELKESNDKIEKRLGRIEVEIAALKIKSGFWGLVGATIPISIMLLASWVTGKL